MKLEGSAKRRDYSCPGSQSIKLFFEAVLSTRFSGMWDEGLEVPARRCRVGNLPQHMLKPYFGCGLLAPTGVEKLSVGAKRAGGSSQSETNTDL